MAKRWSEENQQRGKSKDKAKEQKVREKEHGIRERLVDYFTNADGIICT